MAPRTDLTWAELNTIEKSNFIQYGGDGSTSMRPDAIFIDVSELTGIFGEELGLGQVGVVKALARLLEVARKAQEKSNEGKPTGERMAAFPAPAIGTPTGGFVPVTRSIASRYELSSATSIVATTA
jgi:hypothetical protein